MKKSKNYILLIVINKVKEYGNKPYPQKEETPDVVYEWLRPHTMEEIQAICEEAGPMMKWTHC